MNKTVSLKLSILLKEKGFDNVKENSLFYYNHPELKSIYPYPYNITGYQYQNEGKYERMKLYYLAPTIAEVVMWLYDKYGIWTAVTQELGANITFCYQLMGEHISATNKPYFDTPTEAYESAIEYSLKNLIKLCPIKKK